jgi:hypothetical protein
MGKLGVEALAWGALLASAVATSGAGCSTTKPTELVPGVLSQVVVPHDLQAIRVTVLANGRTAFDQGYDVGPTSTVELPSSLGVVSGTSSETVVTITVRGYELPCEQVDDCNLLGSGAVGAGGARILRRSVQTFVNQHTLFVPMPLSYSCWNSDCGSDSMACKANTCLDTKTNVESLVEYDPSLIDGTDVCFSPRECFGDQPDGGKNLSIAPLLVDADTCTYAFPAPAPLGLNVRAYYQNFTWTADASGQFRPVLKVGGEQEILNEDPVEGFTLVSGTDAGASSSESLFRLAPGLCKLAKAASTPPAPPAAGTTGAGYITISDLRVANLCPPKPPLLPICAGERTNGPGLPSGEVTTDQTCNVGVALAPTESALYLVMDHSSVMHGAFGPMGSATALSLSLSDPVFKRTFAAFTFLPGQPSECTGTSTSFTMPSIDFGLAGTVQTQIASKLNGWTATDTTSAPSPLDLQAAMRFDVGAYAHVVDFLKGKEPPNIAALMFFVNRAPDTTNDCNPPLGGQASTQQAIEAQILTAFNATPSLQTYFVVLDDDAHDTSSDTGALTFFNRVQADLPQAVQVLDATQTGTMQAAQTAAANFAKLVTQLGTCVYDDALPTGTDLSHVELKYSVPGRADTIVPLAGACNASTQNGVDGWNLDNGRLRICGSSCTNLRQAILASAAAALQSNQVAQDIPVTTTILCSGTAPANDASATVDAETNLGDEGTGATSGGSSVEEDSGTGVPTADATTGSEGGAIASSGTGAASSSGTGAASGSVSTSGSSGASTGSSGSASPIDASVQAADAIALP